jgi:uncharacterized membrane protein
MIQNLVIQIRSLYWSATARWHIVRSSYWFIPAIMTVSVIVLSYITIYLDKMLIEGDWFESLGMIYTNKPEGARALLSTVAGSMITVAALVFSITIVTLTMASTQFGPRLLYNFMRDTGNQIVLGTFIATFVYCLLVLRTIRGGEESPFVPHLSITIGVIMALLSISVLIYFIHHVATSIQASNVITGVSLNLASIINTSFPEPGNGNPERSQWWIAPGDMPENFDEESQQIVALTSGYIRKIDYETIYQVARNKDAVIKILNRPGQFIVEGSPIVLSWPANILNKEIDNIISALTLGGQRTSEQDVEFAVDQLVEIAVRALSPGINDPFTAMICIDQLSARLCQIAGRVVPSQYRYDERNQLRLITKAPTFEDILDSAFNQIRQYGRDSAAVSIRLLEALIEISARIEHEENKAAIKHHADMIMRGSEDGLPEEEDREDLRRRYRTLLIRLGITKEEP